MDTQIYHNLAQNAIKGVPLDSSTAKAILEPNQFALLPLINAAYEVRKEYFDNRVTIHIINNGQNGHCPEDCKYCCQAKSSNANIEDYPLKSDEEFLEEAKNAHEKGAHRYCMVFAGTGPSIGRTRRLAHLIKTIKEKYPLEICVSAGLLNDEKAQMLKEAGLDRLNHNLNTSKRNYPNICTTHNYEDRIETLQAAKNSGLQVCSGLIIGMNESHEDIIQVANELRSINAESIPVNMLVPIEGNQLDDMPPLTPEFCLRVLCLFRFINPKAEIRVAAGRELHLRNMEVMAFYPANSLFLDGYLNTRGNERKRTLQMLKDGGFEVESDYDLDKLILNESEEPSQPASQATETVMKTLDDLRPAKA